MFGLKKDKGIEMAFCEQANMATNTRSRVAMLIAGLIESLTGRQPIAGTITFKKRGDRPPTSRPVHEGFQEFSVDVPFGGEDDSFALLAASGMLLNCMECPTLAGCVDSKTDVVIGGVIRAAAEMPYSGVSYAPTEEPAGTGD